MKQFHGGVSYYTEATLTVHFPENDCVCWWCPLLGVESRAERYYCRRTGEYIPVPQSGIGYSCPLNFNKEKENEC